MLNFTCDYAAGAHPAILKALTDINEEKFPGYGRDRFTIAATDKIKKATGCPDAEVFFLTGGTQTNATVIGASLRDYEGVISATTGHIECHEAGAVEYTGHKVLTIPSHEGKIDVSELKSFIKTFYEDGSFEHMVYPGMVYISHPTEYGTLYSKQELTDIHAVCKQYDIPLFVDGARLGYGLASHETDVTLEDLAHNCDVFYIGGTKVGALFGEAVVFTHGNAPRNFYTMTKQHGAMLAKGWLTALQFDVLFTDNLYMNISKHAIDLADELKALFAKHNISAKLLSASNQQFVILEDNTLKKLQEQVVVSTWERYDDTHSVVRFTTSWYTTKEELEELDRIFSKLI